MPIDHPREQFSGERVFDRRTQSNAVEVLRDDKEGIIKWLRAVFVHDLRSKPAVAGDSPMNRIVCGELFDELGALGKSKSHVSLNAEIVPDKIRHLIVEIAAEVIRAKLSP